MANISDKTVEWLFLPVSDLPLDISSQNTHLFLSGRIQFDVGKLFQHWSTNLFT